MSAPAAPPAPASPRAAPPRRRRGYFLPGGIALAVLAVLAVLIDQIGLAHRTPSTLSGPDTATAIAQGIQAAASDHRLPQVRCPASEPVRAGLRFTCTEIASAGAAPRAIAVVETGRGAFTWQPSSPAPASP